MPRHPAPITRIAVVLAVVAAAWVAVIPQRAAAAEVRGTWLTTTGVDHIRSGVNTESTLATLRGAGLNTAYIESWKAGHTQYPSATMLGLTGWERHPALGPVRDLIDESVIQAHRQGMAAVAWFEYGFATSFSGANQPFPIGDLANAANQRGWMLRDINGNLTNSATSFQWMNPAVPEVRQLLIDIVVEAVVQHDLDGIQFDDRLAWPRSLGYDATTNAIINERFNVNITPTHPSYTNLLNQLQDESLDLFVEELHTAVRAVDPDVWISLSPSVNGFSQANYTADWPKWLQQGYFDEVVPQVYRPSIGSFNASLPSNVSPFTSTNREEDGIMGLRFNGSGGDTPLADLLAMIQATRNAANGELAGHSIWYSDNAVDFANDLANFYGGWTENPNLEPGHRPAPVVGSDAGNDDWAVTVTDEGLYRVVAPIYAQGQWATLGTLYLYPGDWLINAPEALGELELLRDRRPLPGDFDGNDRYDPDDLTALSNMILGNDPVGDLDGDGSTDLDDLALVLETANTAAGDLDLDGDVDLLDAQTLAANFGVITDAAAPWALGNLNADSVVDLLDAALLRQNFTGDLAALDAAFAAVPEPAAAMLLLGLAALRRRRLKTADERG